MFFVVKYASWDDADSMCFDSIFFDEKSSVENFINNYPSLYGIDDIVVYRSDCPFL